MLATANAWSGGTMDRMISAAAISSMDLSWIPRSAARRRVLSLRPSRLVMTRAPRSASRPATAPPIAPMPMTEITGMGDIGFPSTDRNRLGLPVVWSPDQGLFEDRSATAGGNSHQRRRCTPKNRPYRRILRIVVGSASVTYEYQACRHLVRTGGKTSRPGSVPALAARHSRPIALRVSGRS